jgi:hypothetical protein
MNKQNLNTLLAQGKTKAVLADLLKISRILDEDIKAQITLVSAQYETLIKGVRVGLLEQEEQTLTLNRVNQALAEIIEELPENVIDLGRTRKRIRLDSLLVKWVVGIVAILVLALIIAKNSGPSIKTEGDNSPAAVIEGDGSFNYNASDAMDEDTVKSEEKD